jgi:glycosyltransferase involved in cell wall biosynthesis
MEDNPLVTIRCLAYNHEPYIAQCLDGFINQKTTFKFEAIVHDDASTDKTPEIIREYAKRYPDIIKPIFESENQYSKKDGSIVRIMNQHTRGKYVAFCEGDDYWIDRLKLQKQIDFLESNPDYGLTYTDRLMYDDSKGNYFTEKIKELPQYAFDDLLEGNIIPTLTVCIRGEYLRSYYEKIYPYFYGFSMGDYQLWLYVAYQSKVHFIKEVTSVYRKRLGSASRPVEKNKRVKFIMDSYYVRKYYIDRYCNPYDEKYKYILIECCHKLIRQSANESLPALYEKAKENLISNGGKLTFEDLIYSLSAKFRLPIIFKITKRIILLKQKFVRKMHNTLTKI